MPLPFRPEVLAARPAGLQKEKLVVSPPHVCVLVVFCTICRATQLTSEQASVVSGVSSVCSAFLFRTREGRRVFLFFASPALTSCPMFVCVFGRVCVCVCFFLSF